MHKIIAIAACFVAVAVALPYKHAPAAHYQEPKEDYHHQPAQYKFEYGVKDAHSGDHKAQWEQRDGKHVKGQYTLEEADGGHRVVEYESDAHGGINFHVSKLGGHGFKSYEPAPVVPSFKKSRY
ncbi:cuticle protein 19-like [Armigeres subalbatus]|uniref:cuticle protein 19-like n=1 Tax=Armigeres subalbatus TaxID=124917 RepID=UPI002ED3318C